MLCFSDSYTVETWKDGKCNTYDIVVSKGDSPFKILKHTTNKKSGHGTRISAFVLRHLPDAAAMTDILSARFLYDPKFVVKINGRRIDLSQHKGVVFSKEFVTPTKANLSMTVIDSEKTAAKSQQHGIAFWISGRLVGQPSWTYGKITFLDGRFKAAKRYTIIIKSDDLIDDVLPDWIVSGFDYDEFYLYNISNVTFMVRSVDEMSDKTSKVTLLCNAKIFADCYYEDYDNAPWDPETKEYVFVDSIKIREEHDAKFGCRIELDRETKSFKIFPFTIILGGDSRKDRYEIEKHSTINDEQEIQDMDRESFGFTPLGSYKSYLEDDLPDSELSRDIVERFEIINVLHRKYEDFCISYDSLLEELNNSDPRKIIKSISGKLTNISDFPPVVNIENIEDAEIEEITLPDMLNYGDSIVIKGIDGCEITFAIDEIEINPSEGSEETINIYLSNNQGEKVCGYIKLTVGYLNFDEDGGASDGLCDEIEYKYHEILKELDYFVSKQKQLSEKEAKIVEIIETALDN